MDKPRVEERTMQYTVTMFLDKNGDIIGEERRFDDHWYDTVSTRPMTEDEMAEYGIEPRDDEQQ